MRVIVEVAREYGYVATGSDIGHYGFGEAGIDFRADLRPRDSVVFNAPFKLNEAFIAHAFEVARYQISMLTRISFLNGQERYHSLFSMIPPELVLILSQRPSMPPGDSDSPAKNGTADYAWVVWPSREQRQRGGYRTIIDWAEPQVPPRQDWLRAAEQIRRFGPGNPSDEKTSTALTGLHPTTTLPHRDRHDQPDTPRCPSLIHLTNASRQSGQRLTVLPSPLGATPKTLLLTSDHPTPNAR